MADLKGWTPFVGLQTEYKLLERTAERELLPMAGALDLAVTAWSPLAGGILSGKYDSGGATKGRQESRKLSARETEVAALVRDIAAETGAPTAAVAIAAIRQLSPSTLVIPVLGARTVEQLRQNMACLEVVLSAEQLARIDKATAIEAGSPHQMLKSDYMRTVISGGALDQLENHRQRRP